MSRICISFFFFSPSLIEEQEQPTNKQQNLTTYWKEDEWRILRKSVPSCSFLKDREKTSFICTKMKWMMHVYSLAWFTKQDLFFNKKYWST